MVIHRVGPVSCAKVVGILYLVLGLIIGACFSLFALAAGSLAGESGGRGVGMVMGVGAIVFFPLLYATIGFIGSLIGAALYNVAAGVVGGVEIDAR